MTGDTAIQSLWLIGAFVLVLSGLIARRLPLGDWLKMALAWIAIFALLFLIITAWQSMN